MENTGSVDELDWQRIIPDKNHDWINQRDPNYQKYTQLVSNSGKESVFGYNAMGIQTNRDSWLVGFSKHKTLNNASKLISHYNKEREQLRNNPNYSINRSDAYIKWTRKLERLVNNDKHIEFNNSKCIITLYRPYTKKYMYYEYSVVEEPRLYYTKWGKSNVAIVTTGRGISRNFSTLVSNLIPNLHLEYNGQGFMRYDNEKSDESSLFETSHDNVNQEFADKLGLSLDDTFAYVYGLLNSPEYQQKYANDLKKDLARIPVVAEKEKYVEIGKKLMDLHINYEEVPVYGGVQIVANENPSYVVKKMKFGNKRDAESGKLEKDKSTIIFNSDITIKDIPEKAYEYVVNGRSAIEWIIDQYQVKTDKKSGITDDPNDFSSDPKYIFNLLLRIINVSVQTVDLVNSLPKLEIIE